MNKINKVELTEFGDPLLRQIAKNVPVDQIVSEKTKDIIEKLRATCDANKYGVGIAAQQIGIDAAIFVVRLKPNPSRPNSPSFDKAVINPEIVEYIGDTVQLWDGCLSGGPDPTFAQTERYKKIRVNYYDEEGKLHENELLDGFIAHVFQHETDHLNGMLFVDRVTNTKSWMSNKNYIAMMNEKRKK